MGYEVLNSVVNELSDPEKARGECSDQSVSKLGAVLGARRRRLHSLLCTVTLVAFKSHALFSRLPPTSTMDSTPLHQKARDRVPPTLDVFIQVLSIAKDTCGVAPAQIAFGSASVLLTMIRARFLPLCKDHLLTLLYPGYNGQRSGFRRPWPGLR